MRAQSGARYLRGKLPVAENRQYIGYDKTLKTGPYNFSRKVNKPNWVQHIPYQNGVLLTYWDASQADNNTSEHPGAGLILPIDARPKALTYSNGQLVSNRLQPFDATFGVEKTDGIVLSRELKTAAGGINVITASVKPSAAVKTFDDTATDTYFDPANEWGSVLTAGSGVKIKVVKESKNAQIQTLQVTPARVALTLRK